MSALDTTGVRPTVADRGMAEPITCGAALLAGKKVPPDATSILMLDHLEAFSLFRAYEEAPSAAMKQSVAMRLAVALRVHMRVEEEILYPAAEHATGDEAMVAAAIDEHAEAESLLQRLEDSPAADDEQARTIVALEAAIAEHVAHEEKNFFPTLRESGIDLYQLGRAVAARKCEILFDVTGLNLMEPMVERDTMSVGITDLDEHEGAPTAISAQEARSLFATGLRNAHATAENCRSMVHRQIERLEQYPRLLARLEQHEQEKRLQLERLETILEELGESPSALKDAAMKLGGNFSAVAASMFGDEILKNSFANSALAHFEIAAYRALIVMGQAAGEIQAIKLLQQSLSEERAMAAWLEDNLPGTVIMHLKLRTEGEQASH